MRRRGAVAEALVDLDEIHGVDNIFADTYIWQCELYSPARECVCFPLEVCPAPSIEVGQGGNIPAKVFDTSSLRVDSADMAGASVARLAKPFEKFIEKLAKLATRSG